MQELYDAELWEKYGVGKDPRCANCMMHCGFESATIFQAISTPKDWATLIKSGAAKKRRLYRCLTHQVAFDRRMLTSKC